MKKMKFHIILTLAILTPAASNPFYNDHNFLKNLLDTLNEIDRLYEKYVLREDKNYWKLAKEADPQYDFVIVGAGSAGSVIASRLSEIGKWNILLLEAGEPETELADIPLAAPTIQATEYNWDFLTEPLENMSYGLENQTMRYPRGKALGGSSVLNYMMYCRGNRHDYDVWAAQGNPGWSYEDVLPYFLKSERARLTDADYRYHNTDGYLSVESSYRSLLTYTFLKAGEEIGLPRIDYNAPGEPFGLSPMQSNVRRGRRDSVARAFLSVTTKRTNLDILTGAFVTKILIRNRRAYGVTYEKDNKVYTITARREVIISAGSVSSPQLLMLSGIGPREHLEEVGINCLQDLPVGRNLRDHLTFYGLVYKIFFDFDQTLIRLITSIPGYIVSGTGPLSLIGGIVGVGYIKTNVSKVKEDQPDIEIMFSEGSQATSFGFLLRSTFNLKQEYYDSIYLPLQGGQQWTPSPVLLHPKSVGYIKLKSKDPHDQPMINPRYFTDPENEDMDTMLAGIRMIQKLANTTAFKLKLATLSTHKLYGCEEWEFDSNRYWECALRSIAYTLYHPIGTAKMGPRQDPTSVVNHHLQVYGIRDLRVADCSIMPTHISGHTHAAAVMVGEKISDIIKKSWGELNENK